jgi:ribosomal protein S18 acetylase RimI-like enzyme
VTGDHRHPWDLGPARPEEWTEAFSILFQRFPGAEQTVRVGNAVTLARRGEFPPGGIIVARVAPLEPKKTTGSPQSGVHTPISDRLLGAVLCLPLAGAGGLIWPPQVKATADRIAVEDSLVRSASSWLAAQGTKVAQALLAPEEVSTAPPLERNGFQHITTLHYLRHDLRSAPAYPGQGGQLRFQTYSTCSAEVFHDTLLETYQESLDCPEVNGVRSIAEIIAGHKAQGTYEPARWLLAFDRDQPAGVLLMSELPDSGALEISYLGVVPSLRRRAIGRQLVAKAFADARAQNVGQLTLSVDARNLPAENLYRHAGFEVYSQREVYLALWAPRSASPAERH